MGDGLLRHPWPGDVCVTSVWLAVLLGVDGRGV